MISQAVVYKAYPAGLSLTVLICFFASLQSSLLALFFARDPALWKLEWNVQLLTIIYCVSLLLISHVIIYASPDPLLTFFISLIGSSDLRTSLLLANLVHQ